MILLNWICRLLKRKGMKSLFNIYYINFAKVYEIKMMLGCIGIKCIPRFGFS